MNDKSKAKLQKAEQVPALTTDSAKVTDSYADHEKKPTIKQP